VATAAAAVRVDVDKDGRVAPESLLSTLSEELIAVGSVIVLAVELTFDSVLVVIVVVVVCMLLCKDVDIVVDDVVVNEDVGMFVASDVGIGVGTRVAAAVVEGDVHESFTVHVQFDVTEVQLRQLVYIVDLAI
jgi:hypothetical protein